MQLWKHDLNTSHKFWGEDIYILQNSKIGQFFYSTAIEILYKISQDLSDQAYNKGTETRLVSAYTLL